MITTRQEYQFVAGDIDLVEIDGGIMPLRTGNTGKVDAAGNAIPNTHKLRGVDICFLLEGVEERYYAGLDATPTATAFSRSLQCGQMEHIRSRLIGDGAWTGLVRLNSYIIASGYFNGNPLWVHSNATFPDLVRSSSSFAWAYDGGGRYLDSSDFACRNRTYSAGDALSYDRVRELFDDIAVARRFVREVAVSVSGAPNTNDTLFIDSPSSGTSTRYASGVSFSDAANQWRVLEGVVLCVLCSARTDSQLNEGFAFLSVAGAGVDDVESLVARAFSIAGVTIPTSGDRLVFASVSRAYGIYSLTNHTDWQGYAP